jgi:hypothetical protein
MKTPSLRRAAASILLALAGATLAGACGGPKKADLDAGAADAAALARDAAAELADAAAEDASPGDAGGSTAAAADAGPVDAGASDALPGTTEGCPTDMVLVHGEYCPNVEQICLEHHQEFDKDEARKKAKPGGEASTVSERCLRYKEPSRCLSEKKTPMRFCMDRYEWPNQKGELPALLVSWVDAKKQCEAKGKRLCTEDEFNFGCEGEAMLPYTYGYVRDATKCSIDKPYRKREKKLSKYERCMKSEACKKELARLDQRLPAGSLPQCVSPFGAYDLNGNINEWVMRPKETYPNRSGLKGGWWGPVRGRCRPTVGFHKEEDYGYEEGFRCCKDAEGSK